MRLSSAKAGDAVVRTPCTRRSNVSPKTALTIAIGFAFWLSAGVQASERQGSRARPRHPQQKRASRRAPSPSAPAGIGKTLAPHVLVWRYTDADGWNEPRILDRQTAMLRLAQDGVFSFGSVGLHYGQTVFEGAKAYRGTSDGAVRLFRLRDNWRRLQRGAKRMAMPAFDEDAAHRMVHDLVQTDLEHVPSAPGSSLYIRPNYVATEQTLIPGAASEYLFSVITSPSGPYLGGDMKSIRLWVNEDQPRATPGGTGDVKAGCNYPAAFAAQHKAKSLGYDQVLWLDAVKRSFVEEAGTANVFFAYRDGRVVTPKLRNEHIGSDTLSGTVLPGITRDSVLQLLAIDDSRYHGYEGIEDNIRIADLLRAIGRGQIVEAFASGTAASIIPISAFGTGMSNPRETEINNGHVGTLTRTLFNHITGIQHGTEPDPMNWIEIIRPRSQ